MHGSWFLFFLIDLNEKNGKNHVFFELYRGEK